MVYILRITSTINKMPNGLKVTDGPAAGKTSTTIGMDTNTDNTDSEVTADIETGHPTVKRTSTMTNLFGRVVGEKL